MHELTPKTPFYHCDRTGFLMILSGIENTVPLVRLYPPIPRAYITLYMCIIFIMFLLTNLPADITPVLTI